MTADVSRLMARLAGEEWLMHPPAHAALVDQCKAAQRAGLFDDLMKPAPSSIYAADDSAILRVRGVMDREVGALGVMFGMADVSQLLADVRALAKDDTIRSVVLDIDSPGGSVAGTPELANAVAQLASVKPVIAWTGGLMASAAYWLAAGASAIYAAQGASVGSIGVYMPFLDLSRMYSAAGVEVDVIKPDELTYKGAGFPGTSLTPEQREQMVERSREIYTDFAGFVASRRRVAPETMRGQVLYTPSARAANLIDSIAGLDVAVADARRLAEMRTNRS